MGYTTLAGDRLQCTLCPHGCSIADGKSGVCGVRFNEGGALALPYYGSISSIAVDPIEKKPLYHFHPGAPILSVGFFGCNFRCPFCQNYTISQRVVKQRDPLSPDELVETALLRKSFGIAYTYSEPVVHFEYVLDSARLARARGLKNVLVSNGFLNPEPAEELLELMDAADIDLKSFSPQFYRKEIGGRMDAVLDFLRIAAKKTALEVTTLVIPGKNDSETEITQIAEFVATLNPDIPLHLSCYFPTYKYVIEATPPERVLELAAAARQALRYVYPGNVGSLENNTTCPTCAALLIRRTGYATEVVGLERGRCAKCGGHIPIQGV